MTTEPAELSEGQLIGLLRVYVDYRRREAEAGEGKDQVGGQLKRWLEAHPGEVLWDGETRLEGRLQARAGTPTYDLLGIREHDDSLFQRLLALGCVSIESKAVKLHAEQLAGVQRYAMPGKGSVALIVEERPG